MKAFFSALLLLAMHAACAQVYHSAEARTGQLPDSVHRALRAHLARYAEGPLRDSVFIKFDFNREHCWNRLDGEGAAHNRSFIAHKQRHYAELRAAR